MLSTTLHSTRAANLAKPISGVLVNLVRSAGVQHNFMTFNAMYLQIKCKE